MIVDTEFCFGIIDSEQFVEFNNEYNDDICLDINECDFRMTDAEAKEIISKVTKCKSFSEFQVLDKPKRNLYLKKLFYEGLSIRQISRLTGISKKIVETNI